jgi:hypothetical protein
MRGTLAIENRLHSTELDKTLLVCRIFKECGLESPIVLGSTGPKSLLRGRLAPYLNVTRDLDIAVPEHRDLNVIAGKYKLEVEQHQLILRQSTREGNFGGVTDIASKSPFFNFKLYVTNNDLRSLEEVDFFTRASGIGPIPIETKLMEPFHIAVVQGAEIRVPNTGFSTATVFNPPAWTPLRAVRQSYLLATAFIEDPTAFREEMLRALSIIKMGEEKARQVAHLVPREFRKDFENYSRQMIKEGARVGTEMKNDLLRVARRVGATQEQSEEFLSILVGSLKSYGTGAYEVV